MDPYECYLEAIRETTPTDTNAVSQLEVDLNDQVDRYYTKKQSEFMKIVHFEDFSELEDYTTHEDFEANNEDTFKAIFKFARAQAKKLNRKSKTSEPAELKRNSFNFKKETSRLNRILDMRHLGFSKTEDNMSDDDDEVDAMKIKSSQLEIEKFRKESEKFQDNIYEHYARKYNTKIEAYNARVNLLRIMQARARKNQIKTKELFSVESRALER